MKCPNCGLENPESAIRCDCGYDFASKEAKESYVYKAERFQDFERDGTLTEDSISNRPLSATMGQVDCRVTDRFRGNTYRWTV